MRRIHAAGTTVLALALLVSGAHASEAGQAAPAPTFEQLPRKIRPGDAVFVIDRTGRETIGTVKTLSGDAIVVTNTFEDRQVLANQLGRVERPGDSVWNGFFTGVAVGAPFWILGSSFSCGDRDGAGCHVGIAAIVASEFGGLGALADYLNKGRTTLYTTASPTRGPVHAGGELWTRIKGGDTIFLRDKSGADTTVIFESSTDTTLGVLVNGQHRDVAMSDVSSIARRGDSVWNGAIVGAALGSLYAIPGCSGRYCDYTVGDHILAGMIGASFYGLVGAGIDAIRTGKTTVYTPGARTTDMHLAVAPILSTNRKGLAVRLTF